MAPMQKVGEHLKLAWTVEGVLMVGNRPAQVDFLADRSRDTPIVTTFRVGGTMFESGTTPV